MSLSRRQFLKVTSAAGGGLLISFHLGCKGREARVNPSPPPSAPPPVKVDAETAASAVASPPVPTPGGNDLNAWIHIAPNDIVTFSIPESEMGQGVLTGLAMILAEHLEADFAKVRAVHAPADRNAYGRQSTGGSTSVRQDYEILATAGATARDLLVAAAAQALGKKAGELIARDGHVSGAGTKSLRYGELVEAAAKIDLGADHKPAIKPWAKNTVIGTPARRLDTYDKVTGRAQYGLDVTVGGMLTALVARSPSVGGKVAKVSDGKARAVAGVKDVVSVSSGVAVLADHYWAAKQGRAALDVSWNEPHRDLDDAAIRKRLAGVIEHGIEARREGNPSSGERAVIAADYEVPYLAHAPLELLSCTVRAGGGGCEVWVSTQSPTSVQETAGRVLGIDPDKVVVHTMMLGGGFGRRSQTDFVQEAVEVAKASGKTVKVVWDREDDVRGYQYRPCALNRMRGALGSNGLPVFWEHRIASPSILKQMGPLQGGIDGTSVEGAANLPYAIPNLRVTYADVDLPVPTWFWRSVGSSQNAYVTECFFDELCAAGKQDPVEARLALLGGKPRHAKVLSVAADKAGWGKGSASGRAFGVAVHECFGSFVAEVASVSIDKGKIRVHEVHCAVDCGKVINPDSVEAQMESGIAYGLTAALYGQINFDKGRAVQGNLDTYRILRMPEMPRVQVHLVPSGDAFGGIGEPGTPPIAPAVANALFALTKKPIRKLPIVLA